MPLSSETVELPKVVGLVDVPIDCNMRTYDAAWIHVYYGIERIEAVYGVDFDVAVALDFQSFTVTPRASFMVKLAALGQGNNIRVVRLLPLTTDITETEAFERAKLVLEFERQTMRDQQLKYLIDVMTAAILDQLETMGEFVLTGSGAPSDALGEDGWYYIDRDVPNLHGPKTAGVWPAGVSMTVNGAGAIIGPGVSINDNIMTFNGVSGQQAKDSGVAIANVVLNAHKNVNNGVAGLDGSGKLSTAVLPNLSIVTVTPVASQVAQLALVAQSGDVAIRTDQKLAYMHNGGTAGTMADWTEFGFADYLPLAGGTLSGPLVGTTFTGTQFILDAEARLDLDAGNPRFRFDSGPDFLKFNKATKDLELWLYGIKTHKFGISGDEVRAYFDDDDYIGYDRGNAEFYIKINSTIQWTFGNTYTFSFGDFWCFNGIILDDDQGEPGSVQNGHLWGDTRTFHGYLQAQRNLITMVQFMSLLATYALTSQQAAQKAFNTPANGAFNVKADTTYEFEGFISLSAMSGSSGGFGFAFLGTATLDSIEWDSVANKAVLATAAAPQSTANVTAANTVLVTLTTATVGWMRIKGMLRTNAAGTLIPAVSLGVAAAAVVGVNSFFKISPIGSDQITSYGDVS